MSLAVSIGLAVGSGAGGSAAPAPASNLLTWTEAFDNAAWAATSASVAANAATDPLGGAAADRVTNAASSSALRQTTTTAAVTGVAVTAMVDTGPSWQRKSVTGTFDGQDYTFSVYLQDATGGGIPALRLRIDRSGGFLRCSIEDGGDTATYDAWGAQLETGSGPTAYVPRTT